MITLGIETSCDETAVALVREGEVLSSEVSSSVHLHSPYGGVVPEIASRFHSEYIFSVFKKALDDAGLTVGDVDLVSVTQGPGLPGSLLVGISFAKAISYASGAEMLGVDHVRAHLFSSFLGKNMEEKFPFVGMVVSGGHTSIYLCEAVDNVSLIGRTKDDAVGEAFDKVAKILGLGYPGGPEVESKALLSDGNDMIRFPRALLQDENDLDFSFSGIKTSVLYHWRDCGKEEKDVVDVCFSFQEAVIDVIIEKLKRAIRSSRSKTLVMGGGVINNNALRSRVADLALKEGVELYLPDKEYCMDNAAMIALLGEKLFSCGYRSDFFLNAEPAGLKSERS